MISLSFSPPLVDALGWTIVHSLWQATLLGGLLWVTSRTIKSAKVRYQLAYGTLLGQLVVSLLTFTYYYEPTAAATATTLPEGGLTLFLAEAGSAGWQAPQLLPAVVFLWLIALLVGTLRLGLSFGRVRRMRSRAQVAVPVDFDQLVRSLAERIGYHGNLQVALSDYIDGPALVGHLKPVLLFPVALINQLTPAEAEAVIIHELAHLRRKDHWWNLLQCIIEVLFQYHPMIWWIGARIREEREHCCDDLVLAYGPGGLPYAKALLYFETQRSTPPTAVALTNNPGGLLGRVQRFLHQQNIPYQMKSRLFLLPLLGLIALVSTAAYAPTAKEEAPARETTQLILTQTATLPNPAPASAPASTLTTRMVPPAIDTLPRGRHQVSSYRNGKSTEFVVEDGAIQSLKIDGKEIPASEFEEHQPMLERMLGTNEKSQPKVFFWNSEKLEEEMNDFEFELDENSLDLKDMLNGLEESFEDFEWNIDGLSERLSAEWGPIIDGNMRIFRFNNGVEEEITIDLDSLPYNNIRIFQDSIIDGQNRIIIREMQKAREQRPRTEEEEIREMETLIERLERKKAAMQRELEQVRREEEREVRATERATREKLIEVEKVIELDARQKKGPDYEDIVKKLRSEGLIPDENVTRFKLDNDTLRINGKKMSDQAHRRFMDIYVDRYGETPGKRFKVEYKHQEN